nr:MAG: E2 protein [Leptonychotes weddellii papillomavirus 13]
MMETLSQRLGALQEQMMDLFEQQSSNLSAHVRYWLLQRQEHAMMYVARQKGLNKLGTCAVPPMHVSKARAEDAIAMHLQLSSLQDSQFGTLPWTLGETSMERYKANPSGTFKKAGAPVTVHYDNSPDNAVEYTLWGHVYDQVDGVWTDCAGGADERGLYINRNGAKEYYEHFQKDSARYGTTGEWTVNCGSETFYFPNSTGPGKQSIPEAADPAEQTAAPVPQRSREAPADQPTGQRERSCLEEVELDRGRREQRKPAATTRGRRRLGDLDWDTDWEPPPVLHGGPWGRPQPYKVDKRGWKHQGLLQQQLQQQQLQQQQQGGCLPGPDPPSTPQAPPSALLPCVVLSGEANQVKCYRYRLWKKYGGLVEDITTTWTWAKRGQRHRESKISLVFKTEELRTKFLASVCLPKGVWASLGMLPY